MSIAIVGDAPENSEKTGKGHPPKKHQWKKGQSGNPGGRPKNTLKDYVRRMFMEMTDEEKEKWLKENKISGIDQWKMGEGNPSNETELKGKLTIAQVLDELEKGNEA